MSVPQSWPILIFMAVHPAAAPLVDLLGELVVVEGGEARRSRRSAPRRGSRPNRSVSGRSSSRALRSHRAMSTALMACMTRPRVPQVAAGAVHRLTSSR